MIAFICPTFLNGQTDIPLWIRIQAISLSAIDDLTTLMVCSTVSLINVLLFKGGLFDTNSPESWKTLCPKNSEGKMDTAPTKRLLFDIKFLLFMLLFLYHYSSGWFFKRLYQLNLGKMLVSMNKTIEPIKIGGVFGK